MTPHQNDHRLEDRADLQESITARLEGAKNSQAQIRFTLGMMAVISTMMLIASYNAYLSYDYRWIIESNDRQAEQQGPEVKPTSAEATPTQPPASVAVAKALTDQALRDWASSRIVMISLLGIRVSVDDAAVLGTSILLILSAWLVLWARRENHTIGRLLRETYQRRRYDRHDRSVAQPKSGDKLYSTQERWLIFHTINSNSIFLTVYPSLRSINSLEGELKPHSNDFKRRLNNVLFLFLRYFFLSFPVLATLIVFLIDRMSYFISDPFHPNFDPPGTSPFFWRSMVVFLVCWIPLTVCCLRSIRYSRDTETVLRQYEDKLKAERAHEYTSQG